MYVYLYKGFCSTAGGLKGLELLSPWRTGGLENTAQACIFITLAPLWVHWAGMGRPHKRCAGVCFGHFGITWHAFGPICEKHTKTRAFCFSASLGARRQLRAPQVVPKRPNRPQRDPTGTPKGPKGLPKGAKVTQRTSKERPREPPRIQRDSKVTPREVCQ